jgi:hypothetical protein
MCGSWNIVIKNNNNKKKKNKHIGLVGLGTNECELKKV